MIGVGERLSKRIRYRVVLREKIYRGVGLMRVVNRGCSRVYGASPVDVPGSRLANRTRAFVDALA